jgi:hypothetical protein
MWTIWLAVGGAIILYGGALLCSPRHAAEPYMIATFRERPEITGAVVLSINSSTPR